MQYAILTLASFIAAAAAQGASGVPTCAASCVNLLPAECAPQDIGCICGDKSFITNVSCCVSQKCSASDQSAALAFAQQICAAGGVTITNTAATCIGSSTSAPASSTSAAPASTTATAVVSASTSSASGSAVSTSTSSGSVSSAATGTGSSASATVTSTSTRTGSSSAASSPSSSVSGGAAPKATAMAGFVGAALAAVALL